MLDGPAVAREAGQINPAAWKRSDTRRMAEQSLDCGRGESGVTGEGRRGGPVLGSRPAIAAPKTIAENWSTSSARSDCRLASRLDSHPLRRCGQLASSVAASLAT
jgi:hypothetical protein